MDTSQDRDRLQAQIDNAFANVVYPGDNNLVIGDRDKDWDFEREELLDRLRGKHWRQLLEEVRPLAGPEFYYYHSIYGFLTPAAFQFYLPAFLIISLDLTKADIIADALIKNLTPPQAGEWQWLHQTFQERLKRLTPEQRKVIGAFIEYIRQGYPEYYPEGMPELRLTDFWSKDVWSKDFWSEPETRG